MTSAPEDRVQPSRQSYLSQSGPEENAEANKETFIPSLLTPSSLDRTASLSQEDIGMRNLGDELDVQYSGFSNLGSADGCETEPLGLPLDEALGSFGQCKLHARRV